MDSAPTSSKVLTHNDDDPNMRGVPPPYPGHEQPGFSHTVTHVHVTPVPVITTRPAVIITSVTPMGQNPTVTVCKSCHMQITTRVDRKPTMKTHLIAVVLCLLGCWPCVCIPYCMDSCRNADHYCPNCNAFIGTYLS